MAAQEYRAVYLDSFCGEIDAYDIAQGYIKCICIACSLSSPVLCLRANVKYTYTLN